MNMDALFTYHPPTGDQPKRYAAIGAATEAIEEIIARVSDFADALHERDIASIEDGYALVNDACAEWARVVEMHCPDSADRSAAIRCVRLVRNALNERLKQTTRAVASQDHTLLLTIARSELYKARWSANSAIALDGK